LYGVFAPGFSSEVSRHVAGTIAGANISFYCFEHSNKFNKKTE